MEDENDSTIKLMAYSTDRDSWSHMVHRVTAAETIAINTGTLANSRYIELDNKVRELLGRVAMLESLVHSLTNRIQLHDQTLDEILNGKL